MTEKKEANLFTMNFRRKFCINPYKQLKFPLSRADFYKDWVEEPGGDPYPICGSTGEIKEKIDDACLVVSNESDSAASRERLLGQLFPYATHEMCVDELKGEAGFSFIRKGTTLSYRLKEKDGRLLLHKSLNENGTRVCKDFETGFSAEGELRLLITCRGSDFDVYVQNSRKPKRILRETAITDVDLRFRDEFINTRVAFSANLPPEGKVRFKNIETYLDSGISNADPRCIRYEDGTPIIENGKVFITMSMRGEELGYQAILSWNPSGCEFKLEGALFFDYGDGLWYANVASSIIYNRKTSEWYVWVPAFKRGHILSHAVSKGDPRFGINVLDATLVETKPDSADTEFFGKEGDEDPDMIYDEESGKWLLTFCRTVATEQGNRYRYFLFESDKPFEGYVFRQHTLIGSDTGGSMVRVGGKLCFVCGSGFDMRACYYAYPINDFSKYTKMTFDYDDGGFRGWGTIIPVPCGNRTKYMWLTFDRHRGSDYTWSYGNIYCFESDFLGQ